MHASVRAFVAEAVDLYRLGGHVLEVGSYDVNGSVRDLFPDALSYLGVDLQDGPGVDQVIEPGHSFYTANAEEFDVVVSTEMLEHDERPWLTVAGMGWALRRGGHLVLTARGFDERGAYGIHDYPLDLWRFHVNSFKAMLDDAGLIPLVLEPDPEAPGVFLVARR